MRRLVASRLAHGVAIIFVVATLTFALIHLAPGDPFGSSFENPLVTPALRDHWRAAYGLDQPLPVQYGRWLLALVRGDFGWSFSQNEPVRAALARAVPRTLVLMLLGLALAFALGVSLGIVQAVRRRHPLVRVAGFVTLVLYAVPGFWFAIIALLAFSYWWHLLPAGGIVDPVMHDYMSSSGRVLDVVRHLVLPVSVIGLLEAAGIARFQRAALLEVMHEDWLRTARAKGAGERTVILRHALRNALLPVITLLGLGLPALLGGAVFVERVFSWPGMGLLTLRAIGRRDYPLVMASVVVATVMVVVGSIVADVCYALVDPRLREARTA